jgi:predicted dehydrogenase
MKSLRFGIVGCGRIAQRHAFIIGEIGTLVSVCDLVKEKAESLAMQYGAIPFYTLDEMLATDKLDVVVICSPNGLHAQHTIMALQAGSHVLCEKPMAINSRDCRHMMETAIRYNRQLFIVKQNRFNPPVMALKRIMDENRLGRIFSVQVNCFWNRDASYYSHSWKGTSDLDGGTLFTQFSHFIDLICWLFGEVTHINGYTSNLHHQGSISFEDTGIILLQFADGYAGSVNFSVNSFEKNMEGSILVMGELGSIKIGGQYLNELEYQHIKDYKVENLPPGNPPNRYGNYTGSMSNHELVYANVLDVINHDKPIATGGMDGLKTVELIERIYRHAVKLTNHG